MTDPVLFVIDDDPRELATFERALRRRYGADYRVIAERSPEAGLDLLDQLAQRGNDVALVAADLQMPGMDGVEFLERARCTGVPSVRCWSRWTSTTPVFPSANWRRFSAQPL